MKKSTIIYLRTDIFNQKLIAGGSVTHTLGVIRGFRQLGYRVCCFSTVLIDILASENVEVIKNLSMPRLLKFLKWKLNCFLSTFFFALQVLKSIKFSENSILYQRYSILNSTGVLLSIFKRIPLVLEYNGSEVWVNENWAAKRFFSFKWLIKRMEEINIFRATAIVVVSQALCDDLVARGIERNKILVNPNGVDTFLFDPEKLTIERGEIRQVFNKQDDLCIFGFIGTFSVWHGIDIIAYMIPQIIKQRKNARFLLIGDGPLLPYLKEQLKNQALDDLYITYTGVLEHDVARKYLASCDIFLCPTQPNGDGSRFFGSPTKLFEYMSLAKPIIASDLEQIKDLLSPSLTSKNLFFENIYDQIGVLIEPHNKDDFVQAGLFLMDLSLKDRLLLGNNARKKVQKYYSWIHHVEKIEKFIHQKGIECVIRKN